MPDLTHSGAEVTFATVHRLAVCRAPSWLPPEEDWLVDRGLVRPVVGGFELTAKGYRLHRQLLDDERSSIDLASLGMSQDAICALGRRLALLRRNWADSPAPSPDLLASLHTIAMMAEVLVEQSALSLPRLGDYVPRLRTAVGLLRAGDLRFGVDPDVDSVAAIWTEVQEDYLQTLGRGYEVELL